MSKKVRGKGLYVHRTVKGCNSTACKRVAIKDIAKETGVNGFYNKCYLHMEHIVLLATKHPEDIASIDNHKLYTY
jgi:hypothetical protein